MYQYTGDPVADAEAFFERLDKEYEKLPLCDYCGERIDDDYYFDIDGVYYHEKCLCELFRKDTGDFIE